MGEVGGGGKQFAVRGLCTQLELKRECSAIWSSLPTALSSIVVEKSSPASEMWPRCGDVWAFVVKRGPRQLSLAMVGPFSPLRVYQPTSQPARKPTCYPQGRPGSFLNSKHGSPPLGAGLTCRQRYRARARAPIREAELGKRRTLQTSEYIYGQRKLCLAFASSLLLFFPPQRVL